jgi:signal transduction histidine kinase
VNGLINISVGARDWPGRALAFARSTEPRSTPTWRTVGVDALLAAVAAVASLSILLYRLRVHDPTWVSPIRMALVPTPRGAEWMRVHPATPPGIDPVAVFFALLTTVPLAVRRVLPVTVFWIVLLGIVVRSSDANVVTFIAVMLAAYSAVLHSRFRGAAVISVLAAGLMVTAAFPNTTPPLPGRLTALLMLIPVVLVGNAMRLWRRRAGDSQARLQTIQAEHEAATLRALAAERSRIAAELHDVVTHNVSVMVVQAGAARRVMAGSPDDARSALLAVEASGRAAMIELQHLLGLLSPVDGAQAPDAELLRPQPGLAQLRPLVDRVTAAGLPVELAVTGQQVALQPGVDLTAYRVVQEALTNVIRHAGHARTAVRLDYRDRDLVIDISNDRPPSPVTSAAPGGSGRGLLGLRERVSLYGGDLDARPRPAGGWRVTARLPLDYAPAGVAEDGATQTTESDAASMLATVPAGS